jgi:hypothetical protein
MRAEEAPAITAGEPPAGAGPQRTAEIAVRGRDVIVSAALRIGGVRAGETLVGVNLTEVLAGVQDRVGAWGGTVFVNTDVYADEVAPGGTVVGAWAETWPFGPWQHLKVRYGGKIGALAGTSVGQLIPGPCSRSSRP